jgi:hypothetical protein
VRCSRRHARTLHREEQYTAQGFFGMTAWSQPGPAHGLGDHRSARRARATRSSSWRASRSAQAEHDAIEKTSLPAAAGSRTERKHRSQNPRRLTIARESWRNGNETRGGGRYKRRISGSRWVLSKGPGALCSAMHNHAAGSGAVAASGDAGEAAADGQHLRRAVGRVRDQRNMVEPALLDDAQVALRP